MNTISVQEVPKVELHCHFEGAAPPSLISKLANEQGKPVDDLINTNGEYKWHDFTSFLNAYDMVSSFLSTPESLSQLAFEYAESVANENGIYLEVFASLAHAEECGLSFETYIGAIADGFERAERKYGIISRIIMSAVRHLGPEKALEVAKATVSKDHYMVVGFGLGGDERMGSLKDFVPAFDVAREAGLGITVHAGEFMGPESVRDALTYIKPSRIGHGVQAVDEPDIVEHLIEEQIVLEVCPGSNVATGLYPDRKSHPFKRLFDAGVRVTLSSDDPPFFNTSVGTEYAAAHDICGLTVKNLIGLTENAINGAFLDEQTKLQLWTRWYEKSNTDDFYK